MRFNDNHAEAIARVIEQSRISFPTMREDILDHLCCDVEFRMKNGQDFELAFSEALHQLAPQGLDAIEKETQLLLDAKIIIMKKLLYSSGLLFSIMTSLGIFLKTMHWLGANEFLIAGMSGVIVIFIPLLMVVRMRSNQHKPKSERIQVNLGLISAALLSLGGVLKTLHLVTANETLLLGTALFSLGFLPLLFYRMYKESVA